MKIKALGMILAVVLAVLALSAFALADEPSYVIDSVEVDGIELDGDQTSVELGDTVKLKVIVKSGLNLTEEKEPKVKVWLYGNDYEEVEAISDTFTIYPVEGYTKQIILYLDLPTDMETGTYTLHVMVYDQEEYVREEFTLYVERERHLLDSDAFDYDIEPSNYIEAGDYFNVKVRLENVGAKNEDVKVTVEVPGLDILDRKTWLNLYSGESETSDEISLRIPESAETGDYEMIITAYYSEGHKFVERKAMLHVKGVVQKPVSDSNDDVEEKPAETELELGPVELPLDEALLISMDSTSMSLARGKEAAFKVSLASFDSVSRLVKFKVKGAQLFADVRIDPSFVQLAGGQKAEAYVYVKMHEDAELKPYNVMLEVTADDKLVQEVQLTLIANEKEDGFGNLLKDSNLKIAFVALVVLLIIIGLLVAFKRIKHDDYPLEPHDDRTYY